MCDYATLTKHVPYSDHKQPQICTHPCPLWKPVRVKHLAYDYDKLTTHTDEKTYALNSGQGLKIKQYRNVCEIPVKPSAKPITSQNLLSESTC